MRPLIIVCGPSGSGKTTLVRQLKKDYNLKECVSVTTRQRRPSDEPDAYRFVSIDEFFRLDMLESTMYNGNYYGTERGAADASDVVILELEGTRAVKEYCSSIGRPYFVLGLDCDREVLRRRMLNRGDSEEAADSRIDCDIEAFKELHSVADLVIRNFSMGEDYDTVCTVLSGVK